MKFRSIASALTLAFLIFFVWSENHFSQDFQSCISTARGHQSTGNRDKFRFTFGRWAGPQFGCSVNFIDLHNGFVAALAGIAVAAFTLTLKLSTDRLWREAEQQRTDARRAHELSMARANDSIAASLRAAKAAEDAVKETRRIGEAQARAYVNIKSASIEFVDDLVPGKSHPKIEIHAENTGQSPARKFMWRPTLRYYDEGRRRSHGLPLWVEAPGISIAAGKIAQSQYMTAAMDANKFVGGKIPTPYDDPSSFIVHLRIEFKFEDVFASEVSDSAFFSGAAAGAFTFDGTKWICGELSPHPRMDGWDTVPNGITEQKD